MPSAHKHARDMLRSHTDAGNPCRACALFDAVPLSSMIAADAEAASRCHEVSEGFAVNPPAIVSAVQRALGYPQKPVLLHAPEFAGNEWKYVKECIDTGWVSSAGSYVNRFEQDLARFTGAKHVVVTVNGTAALHIALKLVGVKAGDEVLMPSLTFIATANACSYCGAIPHFCDVDGRTLGMSADKLEEYLQTIATRMDGKTVNQRTGRRIAAIVPMHTFGHPVDLPPLVSLCQKYDIPLVEDAAESLGSYYAGMHTGRFGQMAILSFNGNKTITTGGGGAIITDDPEVGAHAKHITTTAKLPHAWEFNHDEVGYNYRMPNLNAALGCAQLERLPAFLQRKRKLAERYDQAFAGVGGISFFHEPANCQSNYWLNALLLDRADLQMRDVLLQALNAAGLQARPVWRPMHELPMYGACPRMDLSQTLSLASRIINVPSSAFL